MRLRYRAIWLGVCLGMAWSGAYAQAPADIAPHKRMLDDRLQFSGTTGTAVDVASLESIRIGLYSPPESAGNPVGRAVVQGATLAIEQANAEGGYRGVPFHMVRRWAENPWAAGSREMVGLAYEDGVWAVIGFLEGTSNIAEQIAAKAYLPVVSPVSCDPSLTHARVPWIFRLPPDMKAQALLLVNRGVIPLGLKKVGLVTTTDHDGRIVAGNFVDEMERQGVPPAFHLSLAPKEHDAKEVAERVRTFSPEGVVLYAPANVAQRLLGAFREADLKCPVLLPWIPGMLGDDLQAEYGGRVVTIEPFEKTTSYLRFAKTFTERFGAEPGPSAAYAYDAARIIVKAIRQSGMTRGGVREQLASLSGYEGITGLIQWDNGGGNQGEPRIRTRETGSVSLVFEEQNR